MKSLLNGLILIGAGILLGGVIALVSAPPRGNPVVLRPAPTPAPLVVHVAGAVAAPGVYELPPGARVRDALAAAGGLLAAANGDGLNQAAPLSDGMQVIVAAAAEAAPATGASGGGKVNINTAGLDALVALPGIGPATAQKIIDYREENGAFEKTADIVNVPGIGPSTFDTIKDLITVDP